MKNFHKILIVGLALLAIILAIFTISNNNKSPQQIIPKDKVTIGYRNTLSGLPFHVAKAKGFFDSQNLEIEEKVMPTSNAAIEAIVRGDIDVAISTTLQASLPVNSLQQNKFKIIAHNVNTQNFDGIVVKSISSYQSLSDLKDKKIGVLPGSTAINLMKAYTKTKNLDLGSVEYVQLAPPLQLQALEAGSIDGLFALEQTLPIALEKGTFKKITGSISYEDKDAPIGVIVASQDFLTKKPDIAKKLITALDQAYSFIDSNDAETRNIIATAYKIEPNISAKVGFTHHTLSTKMNPSKVQEYADYLFTIGELKERVDVSDLFYSPKL